jgi:hypothetical protein
MRRHRFNRDGGAIFLHQVPISRSMVLRMVIRRPAQRRNISSRSTGSLRRRSAQWRSPKSSMSHDMRLVLSSSKPEFVPLRVEHLDARGARHHAIAASSRRSYSFALSPSRMSKALIWSCSNGLSRIKFCPARSLPANAALALIGPLWSTASQVPALSLTTG